MYKLTKEERETIITTNEASDVYSIFTYDKRSIQRLKRFAEAYPQAAQMERENGFGGVSYIVKKSNFSWSLLKPYDESRRQAQSEWMKTVRKNKEAATDKLVS